MEILDLQLIYLTRASKACFDKRSYGCPQRHVPRNIYKACAFMSLAVILLSSIYPYSTGLAIQSYVSHTATESILMNTSNDSSKHIIRHDK